MSPSRRQRTPGDLATLIRRLRRRRVARHRRRRLQLVLLSTALGVPILLVVGGFTAAGAYRSKCSLSSLRPVSIGQNTFLYAANGSLLGSIPAERNREPVPLRAVSAWMRKATVAVEDRRFYRHGGVDYAGIARAFWRDLTRRKVVEGGSTLTQQLVRNVYISRERTLTRKLREACLAIQLSRKWSKDRILQEWLNAVYFGNHAYGVEAAAQTYFSKPSRHLTLLEAALLAGLPQAPSRYDPFIDPSAALARRRAVLAALLKNGDITQAQYDSAAASTDLGLHPGRLYTSIREPYFFGYVRDQLIAKYGANTVRSGGLRVYTTINPSFQRAAQDAIRSTLNRRDDPGSALVSINPANGAIRAMTAVTPGRRYEFNLAAQARRQAGSTFKTFVLTAAVADGIDPYSTYYLSAPFHYQPNPALEAWDVATYDHTYVGSTSIANATVRSDNSVYARLTLDMGPVSVAAMAHRLGVQDPLLAVPSIGLGSATVSPLDMASAYATLAAGGIWSRPMAIRRVVFPNGKEDRDAGWGKPERRRVLPDWAASEVTKVLADNVRYGTGTAANIDRPAAGKTGTTDDHTDAWFCGYTPILTTVVWVGYPQGAIPMENVHGIAVAGGTFPAIIWHLFSQRVLRYSPPKDFPEPTSEPEWHPFSGYYAYRSWVTSSDLPPAGTETQETP